MKYGQFVEPGQTLTVTAEIVSQTDQETKLKASGLGRRPDIVSARLVLRRYNLADAVPGKGGHRRGHCQGLAADVPGAVPTCFPTGPDPTLIATRAHAI